MLIYRSGVLEAGGEIPICYNAAAPSTWSECNGGIRDAADIRDLLSDWWGQTANYDINGPCHDWHFDQREWFRRLSLWESGSGAGRVHRLTDRQAGFRRLDRTDENAFRSLVQRKAGLVRAGHFSDFHAMRLAGRHDALNAEVLELALAPPRLPDRIGTALRQLKSRTRHLWPGTE
ncbi:hypothetical protein ACKTEK_07870 [Tepidamorphus sp. 3E244]|uniref:hypothetical protein n=1 Tax=Tepidamorphus sp. 3E244 TaxID=3385498 RepID=UPI0038FD3A31